MPNDETILRLLLANADGQPVLAQGIPWDDLRHARDKGDQPPAFRDDPLRDASDLPVQKWGILHPEGEKGQTLLDAVAELRRLREDEQGCAAKTFAITPNETVQSLLRRTRLGRRDPAEPRYLLLLGGPDEISFELQRWLMQLGCCVGRLCFPEVAQYRAYAEKVVRWARAARAEQPNFSFYTARGSRETADALRHLVRPILDKIATLKDNGEFTASTVTDSADWGFEDPGLLEHAATSEAGILLSVSHGIGLEKGAADERREARQGALVLDGSPRILDAAALAEHLDKKPFFPGGLWFCFACYGAGTPKESAYTSWLDMLAKNGLEDASRVRAESLEALPTVTGSPFVARLPQMALAHQDGPLGFVGHIDLAFDYAYKENDSVSSDAIYQSLRAWALGDRAAAGLIRLVESVSNCNNELTSLDQARRDALLAGKTDPTDPLKYGRFWLTRNDLGGYVFLGDPAVRLPLRRLALTQAPTQTAPTLAERPDSLDPAAALRLLLEGHEPPVQIAARAGVSLSELWRWLRNEFSRQS